MTALLCHSATDLQLELWLKGRWGTCRIIINISYNSTLEKQLTKSTRRCAAAKCRVFPWARGLLCSASVSLPLPPDGILGAPAPLPSKRESAFATG